MVIYMIETGYFDHTILKAEATEAQVAKICEEALTHKFASVCVNQYYTGFVSNAFTRVSDMPSGKPTTVQVFTSESLNFSATNLV